MSTGGEITNVPTKGCEAGGSHNVIHMTNNTRYVENGLHLEFINNEVLTVNWDTASSSSTSFVILNASLHNFIGTPWIGRASSFMDYRVHEIEHVFTNWYAIDSGENINTGPTGMYYLYIAPWQREFGGGPSGGAYVDLRSYPGCEVYQFNVQPNRLYTVPASGTTPDSANDNPWYQQIGPLRQCPIIHVKFGVPVFNIEEEGTTGTENNTLPMKGWIPLYNNQGTADATQWRYAILQIRQDSGNNYRERTAAGTMTCQIMSKYTIQFRGRRGSNIIYTPIQPTLNPDPVRSKGIERFKDQQDEDLTEAIKKLRGSSPTHLSSQLQSSQS